MAAYASLLSLGHILDHLSQHPPRQMAVLDKAHIDSLLENITFLQDFLEEFSLMRGDEIQALEEKIARSAAAAEDFIESRVVDQILEDSEAGSESSSTLFFQDLQKVIEEFESMKKDVMKIKETEGITIMQHQGTAATAGSFLPGASDSKNTMVGFDEDVTQIMEKLTGYQSNLRIISIVGMGGIGKTTLARNVYHNPYIEEHFHVRGWVTISQQYSVNEILSALWEAIGRVTQNTDDELGEWLYQHLSGFKYLIVMDDLWSIECWNDIKRFFPDNNNGSRVMVTTRLSNVADNFRSCTPYQVRFLDEDQSWALFCDKVFGKEKCPPELEEVGETIVRNCRGLPLAIVAISGLLAKSSRTVEYWEYVANDTYAALNMGGDGLCLEILYLSYKHLPVRLKPCFLYMAIFPEDHKIRISRLVKLWVAEGILKPMSCRSLEEIAEDNVKDLRDRNLIQVHDYGSRNKIKTCIMHDLFRDLCLREAQKEKFLSVTMMHSLDNHRRIIDNKGLLSIKRTSDEEELKPTSAKLHGLRKILKMGYINLRRIIDNKRLLSIQRSSHKEELKPTFTKLHRLRKILKMGYTCSDEEIVRLVNSIYIDLDAGTFSNLLNTLESLSVAWNLQIITITGCNLSQTPMDLPAEIWEMPQLTHLKKDEGDFYLPDPAPSSTSIKNGRRDIFVLKNLHTLYKIRNFRCTDEVVGRIPNLRKLGITYREFPNGLGWDHYKVHNLAHLHNLESLFLKSAENVPQNLCFPRSLKKVTLENCGVCWEYLTVVGSLPRLEVLNLLHGAVEGREWKPVEGQFLELKSLVIEFSDLVEWKADSPPFPRLEKLQLGFLRDLKEIPYGIGEIPTLRSIVLFCCSRSAEFSANNIQEKQHDFGNIDLQVRVIGRLVGGGVEPDFRTAVGQWWKR